MFILSVASQKGGVGKTTLATNLAIAAAYDKIPSAIIDFDPQTTSTNWGDRREAEAPVVISGQIARLPQLLETAEKDGYGLVVIDTPPNVGGEAIDVAKAADFVLVPVKPAAFDIEAMKATVRILMLAETKGAAVLNMCRPTGDAPDEARGLIERDFNFPVMSQSIGNRVAFEYAATSGEGVVESDPNSKAAQEVETLWRAVKKALQEANSETPKMMQEAANG